MPSIIDQVAERLQQISYRPATIRQLFVLGLARKLGEHSAIEHYAELARHHNDETLLLAYRRTMNQRHPPRDLGRGFHEELAGLSERVLASRNGNGKDEDGKFLAIKVERRSIAVAVFVDTTLDYHDIRHLRAEPDKADASADDHPEVRKIFAAWHLRRVELSYTAQTKTGKRYGELLITNFTPAREKPTP